MLILTITDADEVVRAVLDAGARGFVLKSDAARDLVAAVEALQSDKTFFTSRVADMVLGGFLGRLRPAPMRRDFADFDPSRTRDRSASGRGQEQQRSGLPI